MVGWELHTAGEPPYAVAPADHDVAARREVDAADGTDLALVSLSSPLGIETLPAAEAAPLLDAWHAGADDLGEGHGLWAAPRLAEPDPPGLAQVLRHPRVRGLQVPATAMATPAALETLAPLLHEAESAGLPVLVHPGPAAPPGDGSGRPVPGWWPALTDYTAQLGASWFAWQVAGRPLLPRLRIGFVALAGLAPLHHERLAQRGGRLGPPDPGVFYETSSYGPEAVAAVAGAVGVEALVHGTDRPYAAPVDLGLGREVEAAVRVTQPQRFLEGHAR